jgi:hypothetical protein
MYEHGDYWTDLKFCIGDFYKNLLINFKFGYNRTKILGALHETKVLSVVAGDINLLALEFTI